ncbi:MAG: 3'(2'),5'-bisphosphate nucleotidase CysQ [Rhodospirillales bacterium]|nr:3'(2'),5'-bisphosphate nucleotidase CysQ [Rhodospirillales bacterium]MCB9996926.1 3'(2'),5'-bisphosphate nucleotidase CysQ [Rhodospirillales bacterium]
MIRRVAVEAGELTLDYFEETGMTDVEAKADGSPVTLADQKAEAVIEKALADITPDVPMVGEEATAAGRIPDLGNTEYFWLVDPLDGTKEFITGSGDYTVNIALIHKAVPVLGVVYAPVKGELYAGHGPGTAVRYLEDSDKEKPIYVRTPPAEGLTVVASLNHSNQQRLDAFLNDYKVAKVLKRGSSLKICAVAAGKADLYPRLGPTCEWDTAAGDAVLRSAGGIITDLQGKDFCYGHCERKFLNSEFIACSEALRVSDEKAS